MPKNMKAIEDDDVQGHGGGGHVPSPRAVEEDTEGHKRFTEDDDVQGHGGGGHVPSPRAVEDDVEGHKR